MGEKRKGDRISERICGRGMEETRGGTMNTKVKLNQGNQFSLKTNCHFRLQFLRFIEIKIIEVTGDVASR